MKLNLSYCSKETLLIIRMKLTPERDAWASERQSALILQFPRWSLVFISVNNCLDVRVCEESSSVSGLLLKNYRVCGWNLNVCPFNCKWKRTVQYFHVVLFILLYKVVLTFQSVDEILVRDHSNESHWAVLSCCTVKCCRQNGSGLSFNPTLTNFQWEIIQMNSIKFKEGAVLLSF